MDIIAAIAEELQIKKGQAEAAVKLIDEGNTIPFIARYRKEATGSLNDEVLRNLFDRLTYLRNLEDKKQTVLSSIEEQGKLTDELKKAILEAQTQVAVDDLYRPYRPKRRTRATIAKEKGLEPLAQTILAQESSVVIMAEAAKYVDAEKDVADEAAALAGAKDIIAENVSDNAGYRTKIRELTMQKGRLISTAKDPKAESVYEMYYEFDEALSKVAGHRTLAINRGEKEKILTVKIEAPTEDIIKYLKKQVITNDGAPTAAVLTEVVEDAYDRLIAPAIERTTVIYPTAPQNKVEEAKAVIKKLIDKHHVTLISLGNGTASRESEQVIVELLKEIPVKVQYIIVNEAGASVYSASKLATEEFPNFDVGQRSATSMARRLQDPLAELVKIDPKSIGVGQYQHDMNQKKLSEALGGVVEDCVNKVGVDLNTASVSLLEYISGISKTIAKNIVDYREENGKFTSRSQLLKVAKLGPKAFEQCAGFMRISDGKNPLDATGVHPESYDATKAVLEKLGYTMEDVKNRNVVGISKKISDYKALADEAGVGEITLRDIVKELEKPARDPREDMPKPILRSDVLEMKDLTPGMVLKGTVRNVIDFGCFVDIGVHQDGLVHISEICDRYIKHPLEAVSVGDIVDVQVMSVDLKKQRIQLTMKIGQGTDKAGKSEHSGSGKNNVDNKADRSNRNNGGKNSRNDRNSTGSKNNNNRNKKPHYIKGKKNNFFDNIILDN